jgi:hypothetical protein
VIDMVLLFDNANAFNQDISGWCVEQISTEPLRFSNNSPLQNDFKPIWGQSCSLEVLSVAVPANGTYTEGEELEFSVNFNETVSVSGSPQLDIIIGSETRQAVYQSGTGTSTLVFTYTIQPGELDTDGIEIDILSTNDGSIQDNSGFNANLTLNNIEPTTEVLVDSRIELLITGLIGDNKVYDGTTEATASGSPVLSGLITGDDVSLIGTPVYTFATSEVDTDIEITTTGFDLSGDDSAKYIFDQPTLSADITAAELSITGLTGDDKIYDGTTEASASGTPVLSGLISGDDVTISGTPVYTFASPNVGTDIEIITTGFSLSGSDSSNYTLVQPTLSADITDVELSITGLSGDDKVYDGTTEASASGTAVLSGVISGEDVSLTGSPVYTFANSDVDTDIQISTTGFTLSGTDAANYTLIPPMLSASISPAELVVVANSDQSKIFGSEDPIFTFTSSGFVVGEDESLLTGALTREPGEYVGQYNIELGTLAAGSNYTLNFTSADFEILPATQTGLEFADNTFTYDGTAKSLVVAGEAEDAVVTYVNNDQTEAGSYTVEATVTRPNFLDEVLVATLTIEKANQTITFDALASRSLEDDSDFQLEATASSGLEVSYSFSFSSAQPAATVTPAGFVELLTSGQIVITASQLGNDNYEPATSIDQPLMITSSNADITSITIDGQVYNNPRGEVYYLIDCENATSFVDVEVISEVNAQVSTGTNFSIDTPVPGIYRQQVVVTSQDGTQTRTYLIVVEKAFDFNSIVVQKYNNTLVVNNNPENNGGYSFISYQWYKNGALVSERQAFSEGDRASDQLDPNADYQAVMVTTSGDELRTCISRIQFTEEQQGLSLDQNPVMQGSMLKARAQYSEEELKNATFQVYDLNGRMLLSVPATGVENSIQLPDNLASGLYKLILITGQRQENVSFIRQ